MFSDKPVENKKRDKLGRYPFATEVANGLVNSFRDSSDSIVIGINGYWGSGKSTLVNFIVTEIEKMSGDNNDEIIILRFNPWMFSGQRELQEIFFKELYIKFQEENEKFKNISEKLSNLLNYFHWIKYINTGLGDAVGDAQKVLDNVTKAKSIFDQKEEIDKIIINSNIRIYITIDDIDRLTPQEITDIFQLVKLNGNFANTIFILAYDYEIVESALKNRFGKNGVKYIEKIVQIDYSLPQISYEIIRKVFIDSLFNLFSEGDEKDILMKNKQLIKDSGLISFFSSIRDVYRYVNSIKIRFLSIYKELNIVDFFVIEAIRIFDKETYKFIIENKHLLVHKERSRRVFKEEKSSVKEFIETKVVNNVSKALLIKTFINLGEFLYRDVSINDLIRQKRIANEDYFDRYFNLQLLATDIAEHYFSDFILTYGSDEKNKVLEEFNSKNKLVDFLELLSIKVENYESKQITEVIKSILNFAKGQIYKRSYSMVESKGIFEKLLGYCSKIISYMPKKEQQQVITDFFEKNKSSFVSLFVLDVICYSITELEDNKSIYNNLFSSLFEINYSEDDLQNNETFISKIKDEHRQVSIQLFDSINSFNGYMTDYEYDMILSINEEYNREALIGKINRIISDEKELIKYVWLKMHTNKMVVSSSDGTNKIGYGVTKSLFPEGVEFERICNNLKLIDKENLSEDYKIMLNLFFKAENDGFLEGRYYNPEDLSIIER